LKQLHRDFSEYASNLAKGAKSALPNQAQSDKAALKQAFVQLSSRMESISSKTERVNTEMIRSFSQLIGK